MAKGYWLLVGHGKETAVSYVRVTHCTDPSIHLKVLTMRFCSANNNITLLVPWQESQFTHPAKGPCQVNNFCQRPNIFAGGSDVAHRSLFVYLCCAAVKALTAQPEIFSLMKYYRICTYPTAPQFNECALLVQNLQPKGVGRKMFAILCKRTGHCQFVNVSALLWSNSETSTTPLQVWQLFL